MPTNKPKDQKEESPEKPIPESQVSLSNVESQRSREEHVRSSQTEQKEEKKDRPHKITIDKIPKIDVIEGIEANQIARRGNTIFIISVIINAFILAVTAWLAIVAVHQYQSADSAAKTAQNTLTETKKFDSITLNRQETAVKKTDTSDSIKFNRDTATFNLQKAGLKSQINSLNETQKEFELESRPLVQVADINVRVFKPSENLIIDYNYANFGKQPVKVISAYTSLYLSKETNYNKFEKIAFPKKESINLFAVGVGRIPRTETTKEVIPENIYNDIANNKEFIYLFGKVTYENTFTSKKSFYYFNFRIGYNPKIDIQCLEDTIVKESKVKIDKFGI